MVHQFLQPQVISLFLLSLTLIIGLNYSLIVFVPSLCSLATKNRFFKNLCMETFGIGMIKAVSNREICFIKVLLLLK